MTTPPTDPLVRKEPPLDWYRTPAETHPRVETPERLPDLDPDIALWPVTPLQRWPFTGAPAEGIWPKGWMGVDNTGTTWVCTVGGQPGTWAQVGGGGSGITSWGQESTAKFAGSGSPSGVVTPSHKGDLYVDDTTPALYQATGVADTDWQLVGTSVQTRFVTANPAIGIRTSLVGLAFPLVDAPAGALGPVFGSIAFPVAASGEVCGAVDFQMPNDGGAALLLNYVEVTVISTDGTEALEMNTPNGWTLSVAAGASVGVDFTVMTDTYYSVGTDLSVTGGEIKSTAGGVFAVQVAFDGTV